jgi:hypothetical protein
MKIELDLNESDLVNGIRSLYEKSAREKMLIVKESEMNREYIIGNQNQYYTFQNGSLQTLELEDESEKAIFNRMGQISQKRQMVLLRNKPDIQAKKITQKLEIDKKVKITNSLIKKIKKDNNFDSLYKMLVQKVEHEGFGFYKIIYDTKTGDLVKLELKRLLASENIFGKDEISKMATVIQKIRKGSISIYVGGLFELYPQNIRSNRLEDNDWIIHAKPYHILDIKKAYGVTVQAENISSRTMQERNFSNNISDGYASDYQNHLEDYAMVIEYYEKPTYNSPKGRKVVIAGNRVIDDTTLPYQCGTDKSFGYNFVVAPQIPVDGSFFGHFIYSDLRPVQRRYNELRNMIYEFGKTVSIGQYQVPKGALDDVSEITNGISGVVEYNAMYGEIKLLESGHLPSDIWNEITQCEREMATISGISLSTLNGQPSPNIRSGEQMQQLSQSDENSVGLTAQGLADMHEELFIKALRILKQKTEKLPIEVYDNEGLDVMVVTPNNILEDIEIVNRGIIGLTEQQQINKTLQASQLGLFNKEGNNPFGEQNSQMLLETLGLGHLEIDNDAKYQLDFVNYENNKMIKSLEPLAINDFDDDALHIKVHERMLMTSEYNRKIDLDADGAEKHKRNLEHINQHKQRLSDAQLRQQVMAQLQKSA